MALLLNAASRNSTRARRARILPVHHFHVVFTLPPSLRPVVQQNRRLLYTLLFRTGPAALLDLAADAKHLGDRSAVDVGPGGLAHRDAACETRPVASSEPGQHGRKLVTALLWLLAGGHAALFATVVIATIGYPFQLEWMEGGTVDVVQRVLRGEALYAAPTLDYVPYVYAPLYYWASAGLSAVTGVGLLAPRLVSLLSTLGSASLVASFVRREGGSRTMAVAGAGMLLATFPLSGQWMHLARVDALFLLLTLLAGWMMRYWTGIAGSVAAALAAVAAVMTKQIALVALLPPLLVVIAQDWHRGALVGGLFAGALAASVVALDVATDGWFRYFTWVLPMMHDTSGGAFGELMSRGLLALILAGVLAGVAWRGLFGRDGRAGALQVAFGSGLLGSALLGAAHSGAYLNVLMPAHAALCIAAPLATAVLRERPRRAMAASIALLAQLVLLAWSPQDALPTEADRRGGERFLAYIGDIDGEVLIPHHRWLQERAGKTSYGLGMAAEDVLRADRPNGATEALRYAIATAVQERRFDAIILVDPVPPPVVARHYEPAGTVFEDDATYVPVTGAPTRPNWVFVPKGTGGTER